MKRKSKKKIDINHLSFLANIPLSKEEKGNLKNDLEKTVSYIEILSELKTEKTAPIFQTTKLTNVFSKDTLKPCLSIKEALVNAPKKIKSYFVSKKVIWE